MWGVVVAAGSIAGAMERVLMAPETAGWASLVDATAWWERIAMASMVVTIVAVGIYPRILTDAVESGIAPIAAIVGAG